MLVKLNPHSLKAISVGHAANPQPNEPNYVESSASLKTRSMHLLCWGLHPFLKHTGRSTSANFFRVKLLLAADTGPCKILVSKVPVCVAPYVHKHTKIWHDMIFRSPGTVLDYTTQTLRQCLHSWNPRLPPQTHNKAQQSLTEAYHRSSTLRHA